MIEVRFDTKAAQTAFDAKGARSYALFAAQVSTGQSGAVTEILSEINTAA